jgi:PAS domain S-box-containing protein
MDSANTGSNPSISSSPWREQKPHGHAVQFYTEDKALINGLGGFIGTALAAGDAAIVIATKAHRRALLQSLEARGVDASSATQQGRFASLDAQKTLSRFTINDWPDPMQFAEVIGGLVDRVRVNCSGQNPCVVAFGEMVSLLWEQGKPDAAIALERLWNDLAKIRSFSLRCAYPMAGFARGEHSEPFLKICAEHSSVIPDESYTELHSETARLRDISVLQQKALALRTEAAERRDVQKSLQRRESELADILENAIEGVQQVGPDRRILWTNRALLKLLGYSAAEYLGHSLGEFHVHADVFEVFWAKLMRREDVYDFPAELRCKDGSIKQVLIHSNGLWEGDKFVHTRCFIRDVTEQKRLERSLRNAEKQAAIGRVAAIIAHEINNPLETVTNVFYLLRDHPSLDEDARELACIANEEIARVRHIAKQTLAFCRDSENPVPVVIRGVLDAALEALQPQIQSSAIAVDREISTDGLVLAFPVEIRQVFINLISNAIQAMPAGGTLRVSLHQASEWTRFAPRLGIRVTISDTGVGIPLKHRSRIFEPFFTTKEEKGTGIGLWVSRGIVQKFGGTIQFRSKKSRTGFVTSFAVFIPTNGMSIPVV